MDEGIGAVAVVAQELALFAAAGFLVFGIDDLLVDLIWIVRTAWRRCTIYARHPRATAETLEPPKRLGRLAIFVPAWDESDVIGRMLASMLGRLRHPDFRVFVGCYPNDPQTREIVDAVTRYDARVRAVTTPWDGPTTKADCLNAIYRAMTEEERGIM